MAEVIDSTYLPYSGDVLRKHFAEVAGGAADNPERHVAYYVDNARRLHDYTAGESDDPERRARQIERDERFWVASALMGLFHSAEPRDAFAVALTRAIGDQPPLSAFRTWREALSGQLRLYFEVGLSSP